MDNLERMIALAEQFFAAKDDPEQLAVDAAIIWQLKGIHPATLSEARDEKGPFAWVILIPTTHEAMERFLAGEIGERQLLAMNATGSERTAIYLCSALVLPEYRGKGVARQLTVDAIHILQHDYDITDLYVWAFSLSGRRLAASIALSCRLPLHERVPHS